MSWKPDLSWLDAAYEDHLARHRAESELNADWGYSFFYCPAARLQSSTVGIIGLNPGGGNGPDEPAPPHNRHWEHDGFAYLDQPWGRDRELNPLQIQIQRLVDRLPADEHDLFAAQLVPFRSPDWGSLPNNEAAVATFEPAWKALLETSSVRLWFSLGSVAGERMRIFLGGDRFEYHESGWGKTSIGIASNAEGVVVVSLPHLSRYQLFSLEGAALAKTDTAIALAVEMSGLT